MIKELIGNPFCEHKYKLIDEFLIQTGTNKMWIYKCCNCPKEKYKTL